jgi:hypothetical protein
MIRCTATRKGSFSHGYYTVYCYLPLYIFRGEHLLCARLRPASTDAAAGTVAEVDRIVRRIRASWPDTRIIVRGDSGFCREDLMIWCEDNDVDFLHGLAGNNRLEQEPALAKALYQCSGQPSHVFKDFCTKPKRHGGGIAGLSAKLNILAKAPIPDLLLHP